VTVSPSTPGGNYVGLVVNEYRVERLIAEGGMGAVYFARHIKIPDLRAAMKVILKDGREDPQYLARFEQEARIAAKLAQHIGSRVVKVINYGSLSDRAPYMLMEFVDGVSLDRELENKGAMQVEPALKLICRVIDVLIVAVRLDIVHRDLKPQNIMIVFEGTALRPKVLDWGIAQVGGRGHAEGIQVIRTQTNMFAGTPGFMPSEQWMGGPYDERTDVFALGVILYLMLTKHLPFGAPTDSSQNRAHYENLTRRRPAPASSLRPSSLDPIPPLLDALIERCLASNMEQRPRMAELLTELTDILKQMSGGAPGGQVGTLMSIANPIPASTPSGSQPALAVAAPQPSPPSRSTPDAQTLAIPTPSPTQAAPVEPTHTPPSGGAMTAPGYLAHPSQPAAAVPAPSHPPQTMPSPAGGGRRLVALLALLLIGSGSLLTWLLIRPKSNVPAPTPPAGPVSAEPVLVGRLKILTAPAGAQALEEDRPLGRTPLDLTGRPGEEKTLVLRLDGYDDQDVTVQLVPAGGSALFQMVKRSNGSATKPTRPKHAGEKKTKRSMPSFGDE
jgi:serine/threonine-protein kinase